MTQSAVPISTVPPNPPPEFHCPVSNGTLCAEIARMYRYVESRVATSEATMIDHMAVGFAGLSKRIDGIGEAIGELRDDLRTEVTENHVLGTRLTRTEADAARSSSVAEAALSETAKLGARKGRRAGRLETALAGLLGVLAYALAKHYGVPLP